jgi:hypothetical protein
MPFSKTGAMCPAREAWRLRLEPEAAAVERPLRNMLNRDAGAIRKFATAAIGQR